MKTRIIAALFACFAVASCGDDPTATVDEGVFLSSDAMVYQPGANVTVSLENRTKSLIRAGHCESPNIQRHSGDEWVSMVFLCSISPPPVSDVNPSETLALTMRYDSQVYPAGEYRAFQEIRDGDRNVIDVVYSSEFTFEE